MRVTVDASVAVKWFVEEEGHREALALTGPRIERHAPDLILPECANVIWKKHRRGEIDSAQAFVEGVARIPEGVALLPGAELVRDAAEIALRAGHAVYDCFYIACAKLTDSILVTSDRRLPKIVSQWAPSVIAVRLDDGEEMDRIEAAGARLIIAPETVAELIEAWDRFAATLDSVQEDILSRRATQGRRILSPEQQKVVDDLVEMSPTYRRLLEMMKKLPQDERVDLLMLGWAGRGEPMTRRRLLEHALLMVDQLDIHYIAHLGAHWRAGHARLAG